MLETQNLKLKKPGDNDILDPSLSINPNMDIIDTEIGKIKEDIKNISSDAAGTSYDNTNSKLTSTNVQGAIDELNTKTNENKTSISNLKTKVDNGQNFKLTKDDGGYIEDASGVNIDTFFRGWKNLYNIKGTLPPGIDPNDNNVIIECKGTDTNFIRQVCYDVRSPKSWQRMRIGGSWKPWGSL